MLRLKSYLEKLVKYVDFCKDFIYNIFIDYIYFPTNVRKLFNY